MDEFEILSLLRYTRCRWLDESASNERRGSADTASLEMPPPKPGVHLPSAVYHLLVPRCTSPDDDDDDGVLVAVDFLNTVQVRKRVSERERLVSMYLCVSVGSLTPTHTGAYVYRS